MRRPFLTTVAAVMALAGGGCGVEAQHQVEVVRPSDVPFDLLDPEARPIVPTTVAEATEAVELCYVRDGRLAIVERPLDAPTSLADALRALASLPGGQDQSVRTAIEDPGLVREVRSTGGIARVDLRSSISALPGNDQLLALAQIVCTLTGRPGIGQVSFTIEGTPIDVPRADGSLVSRPVARDDYALLF